ncbi:hypothetical protein QF037_002967 [Streptomyces canus]|nr:hypothetical protein [Streptomyces canus]
MSSKAPQSAESCCCARFRGPRDVRSLSPRMPDNSALERASRVCGARLAGSLDTWREFTSRQPGAVPWSSGCTGTGWGSARGRRRSLLINQWANVVRWEQFQAVVPAIKGDETVLAKVRGRVWSPRAGRLATETRRPVTSRSSRALIEVAPFRRESDRNASCASADHGRPGARTPSTWRGVYRPTYRLSTSCEASPQISAPALVRTHQRQLTGTCKLFGMPRNRNTGAPRLVVIT